MSFAVALQEKIVRFLRWSERYTKTDMVYLVRGGFWLVVGQGGSVVLALALATLFGHFATQDTYGNYKYVISLGSLLGALSLSGISTAVTRAAARGDEGSLAQAFALNLRWSMPMVCVGIIASIYYYIQGNLFVSLGLILASISLPFINGFSLYDSFLVGLKQFRRDTLYGLASLAITTVALAVTLLFISQRAIVLVGVYFFANLATDLIWYWQTSRIARNDKRDPDLFRYGFHLSAMGVIGAIADKIDSIAVFSLLGPADLAIYTYAIAIPEQIKNLIKLVGTLSLPGFAGRTMNEIKKTIWVRIILLSAAISCAVALYILVAYWIFEFLFPVYMQSVGYSTLYALSLLFSGVTPLMSVLQAHKRTKELYIVTNVGPFVLVVLLPILTYEWGILGTIIAQIVYRLITTLTTIASFMLIRE